MTSNSYKPLILMVEDEAAIRDMLRFSLSSAGFSVADAASAKEALCFLKNQQPSLILVDWMLPEQSGVEFIKGLKKNKDFRNIPIIMLTARAEEENKIKGLEVGADDYMTKPFSPKELIARIKTVLRRGVLYTPGNVLCLGPLKLDAEKHELTINDDLIDLTAMEFKLLEFFLTHQNKTYSRDRLMSKVWGYNAYIDERTVDVQVRRLRNKLKSYACDHLIKTIRGLGYQLSYEEKSEK